MVRSSVVLPEPDGPSSATSSPEETSSDTSSSAARPTYLFEMFSTRTCIRRLALRSVAPLGGKFAGEPGLEHGLNGKGHKGKGGQQ